MEKPGFSWITPVLCVNNLGASLEHYRDVLGFDISWSWSDDEAFVNPNAPTFACVTRGEFSIFLCQNGQGNPGSWICLNVSSLDDLDSIHGEYVQSGATIVEAPVDCPWGNREMIVEDPDGNTFRIGCALES